VRQDKLLRAESLEPRLPLAGVFSFLDVDGDIVTVRSSRGDDVQLGASLTLNSVGSGLQLASVNLNDSAFAGTRLEITAVLGPSGNGTVHVGEINSPHDLNSIVAMGDVARIRIGDANASTPAIRLMDVGSIGKFGITTGAADTVSNVNGSIRSLRVRNDIKGASVSVNGRIDTATINGSVVGENAFDGISATAIGTLTIGGLRGGAAIFSGQITSSGPIRRLVVNEIIGGVGPLSGTVSSGSTIGRVSVSGSIFGGAGESSGQVFSAGGIGRLSIGGSIFGGSSEASGSVVSIGRIRTAQIGENIVGNTGVRSGVVESSGGIDSMRVGGSIIGGSDFFSGSVAAPGSTIRRLDVGAIISNLGRFGGSITAGNLGTVTVRGSILGLPTSPVLISALGVTGRAIGSLTVQGDAVRALVLAGYDKEVPAFANARIGRVVVRGGLIETSIAAGVENVLGPGTFRFGDLGDTRIGGAAATSRIDSVSVGSARGDSSPDSFGIVAMSIGSVRIGGARYQFLPAVPSSPLSDNFAVHDLL